MKNLMFIVAAPSGAGKSSFVNRIIKEVPTIVDVVTYTTRLKREGEEDGVSYFFVNKDKFEELFQKDFFVESAKVHNNYYGTPFDQIENAWKTGKSVIMDIDVQGAATFRKKFPDSKHFFILPPSIEELRRRLIFRSGGNIPEDMDLRMKNAAIEMEQSHLFEYKIINDEFEKSYGQFKDIILNLLAK